MLSKKCSSNSKLHQNCKNTCLRNLNWWLRRTKGQRKKQWKKKISKFWSCCQRCSPQNGLRHNKSQTVTIAMTSDVFDKQTTFIYTLSSFPKSIIKTTKFWQFWVSFTWKTFGRRFGKFWLWNSQENADNQMKSGLQQNILASKL